MKHLLILATALSLCGCATIVKGSTQPIALSTPPTSGAYCSLSNGEEYYDLMSPGFVYVEKGVAPITVECTKSGWQPAVATIPSNFQAWTAGNILLGGLVGLGIDAASGAIHQYPLSFRVPMHPATEPPQALRQ